MRAKEYLQQLKKMDIVIQQKVWEACRLNAELKRGLKPINYMEKVQTSTMDSASFARLVDKKIDLENEINAEIDEFITMKHKIINQIQGLEKAIFIEVLYKKYVEFKGVRTIVREMHYSRANMFKILNRALLEFEKKYFNDIH